MRAGFHVLLVSMMLLFGLQVFVAGASHVVVWQEHDITLIAAHDSDMLRLASVKDGAFTDLITLPVAKDSLVKAGSFFDGAALLVAQGKQLFRFDLTSNTLLKIGDFPAPILQLLPARGGKAAAVALTGDPGTPVPVNGVLYQANWEHEFTCAVVVDIPAAYRPWKLWWAAVPGEERLAVATYKSTAFANFAHNCMFLYAWKNGVVEKRWLGSRLSRPYLDVVHCDQRMDGNWCMVALEVTADGGNGLSCYTPAQFGYVRDWTTESVAGMVAITAFDSLVLLFGHDTTGKALAWRLNIDGDNYHLTTLAEAPPSLDELTRLDDTHLAGWWTGGWHSISLPDVVEKKKGD